MQVRSGETAHSAAVCVTLIPAKLVLVCFVTSALTSRKPRAAILQTRTGFFLDNSEYIREALEYVRVAILLKVNDLRNATQG